jgi:signal transduction histidine kinase
VHAPAADDGALAAHAESGEQMSKSGTVDSVEALNRELAELRVELARCRQTIEELTESAQRHADENARRVQKLEAIGALAGSVAHDFSNLFTSILGYASILEMRAGDNREVARAAEVITASARRASDLAKHLGTLARKGRLTTDPVDVHALVRETAAAIARRYGEGIVVDARLDAIRSTVSGDPHQLGHALMQLGANACEAISGVGLVVFETRTVELADEYVQANPSGRTGAHLEIVVRDTGPGVVAEIRDRIFDPFFTTKPEGEHLGLGLSMTFGVARNHGGSISLMPPDGAGAAFRVLLPLPAQ